jgi:hypothetical protein
VDDEKVMPVDGIQSEGQSASIGRGQRQSLFSGFSGGNPERRGPSERRSFSWATLFYGELYNRRRQVRREGDQHRCYTDWYDSYLLYMAMGILLLSAVDAALTLNLLQMGSTEFNPFMAMLIRYDIHLFVGTKLALTGIGLILLVMHANFKLLRVLPIHHLLSLSLLTYLCLTGYELLLLGYSYVS